MCNCLRNQVPKITQQYHHKTQIPYAAVEPETKYHLILLPDYILPSLQDLSLLREEALKAEIEGDFKLAEIIWTRLLKFDTEEALASLYRIRDKLKGQPSSETITKEIPSTVANNSKSVTQPNLNLSQISPPYLPIPKINRRQLLKGLAWGFAGIGIITLVTILNLFLNSRFTVTVNPVAQPEKFSLIRFQNSNLPGTFLYASEEEAQSIRENFMPPFVEEGIAFSVFDEAGNNLIPLYRFQNVEVPGTFLYASKAESESILANYPEFVNEGIAFYAYPPDANIGEDIYRFENTQIPKTYIYVGEEVRQEILDNYREYFEEDGVVFEALSVGNSPLNPIFVNTRK